MKTKSTMFGGENADQYNALADILIHASGGWDGIYALIEKTPRATLITRLGDSMLELGYQITLPQPNDLK